jgi:hypothetical protein
MSRIERTVGLHNTGYAVGVDFDFRNGSFEEFGFDAWQLTFRTSAPLCNCALAAQKAIHTYGRSRKDGAQQSPYSLSCISATQKIRSDEIEYPAFRGKLVNRPGLQKIPSPIDKQLSAGQ